MLNSSVNAVHLKWQWVNMVGGHLEMETHGFCLEIKVHKSQKQLLKFIITAVKKAERRRIDAFELWCWRRLLRISWTARRSNQSILKEISPGCSLEGMMLKLKL